MVMLARSCYSASKSCRIHSYDGGYHPEMLAALVSSFELVVESIVVVVAHFGDSEPLVEEVFGLAVCFA